MNIIVASSEVVPYAKTGGLADVCGALPAQLESLGHQVSVVMPGYRSVTYGDFNVQKTGIDLEIPIGSQLVPGELLVTTMPGTNVKVYLVANNDFYDRESLYGEKGVDYQDNAERFIFFSRAVLEAVRLLDLKPDLIHCNDWQTGLIPALLKVEYDSNPLYERIASLITIHNLAYQGTYPPATMPLTGLDWKYYNFLQMEFFDKLNLLKTGIVFADSINTVSPTYAQEIQTAEQGCGLEGVLEGRSDVLSGILNGIDVTQWNPEVDDLIPAKFSADDWPAGKAACKKHLQDYFGLEQNSNTPMIGIVGRLATQKGWSLILQVMQQWLESTNIQWVVLGTGAPEFHTALTSLYQIHPNKLGLQLGFSNELAHQIEAGADIFVMPSEYEPCGLNQMYSMAYGTVPVVRQTGGLADTVVDASLQTIADGTANGFSFEGFTAPELERALTRAIEMYRSDKKNWNNLVNAGIQRDWSWAVSAKAYESLYLKTVERKLGQSIVH